MPTYKHLKFNSHHVSTLIAVIALLCLFFMVPTPVLAADKTCEGDCVAIGEWDFSFSVGMGSRSNPVIGQDDVPFVFVPKFSYYGKRFFLDSYDVGYTFLDAAQHQINAILISPGFEQAFFSDWELTNKDIGDTGSATYKLHKRSLAGLSGLEYTFIHANFDWQTQILQDVTSVHKGQKIRTAITLPWAVKRQLFEFSAGATWQSQELVNYYYGVRSNEVNNPELSYQSPASTSFFVKSEWETRLTRHWGLRAIASYKWLGKGITDSPIVEEDSVFTIYAAGVYHF